ncbi:unnamed protein product [Adineta steineri]|uniref:Microbial-type PARG catalytic domain-containing protein n=1 Tax=Adineta steineri TaxID=433720 RepID=A0A819PMK3_9BILA|nr:unnamed protein product [Adineta steineri]CAF4016642.1 unnamed protein product [Adineta steineri]
MPDPLSVYVPLQSLTKEVINSLVSTIPQAKSNNWDNSRRTLLAFLLAINNKLNQIEKHTDSNNKFDEKIIQHAREVRQWLAEKHLKWDELQTKYEDTAKKNNTELAQMFNAETVEPYYELTFKGLHPDVMQSRKYMARFRSHGWDPKDLKVYWNAQQLEDLCPKHEINSKQTEESDKTKLEVNNSPNDEDKNKENVLADKSKDKKSNEVERKLGVENKQSIVEDETINNQCKAEVQDGEIEKLVEKMDITDEHSNHTNDNQCEAVSKIDIKMKNDQIGDNNLLLHDPSDADAIQALYEYPVSKRNHAGKITYVNKGIEKAVFDAPKDAQLIVLNFANERSPGGGYLRHALAQEETILYNSDGYRSLLDLKYGRMGGGYAIPEFGLAYVRDIRFVDKKTGEVRKADMLVSACYCLSASPQLYDNPKSTQQWITNNLAKFRAFIAAAVANTKGDGSNTYLLLGPIGTGAFGNDVTQIGYAFRDVLKAKIMGSNGPIRYAFENIWFISTDKWKNELVEKILNEEEIRETD